jgi:predicted dehydrogenase
MGYHTIDMIIWYFGLPDKVIAEFESGDKPEETAFVLFGYDTGVYGSAIISRSFPPKTELIKVCGTRGIIEVERGCIKRLRKSGEVTESLNRDTSWPIAATKQIDYFCKVIKGEAKNIGDPFYHLQHIKFIEACYESKKQGKYVNPKDIGGFTTGHFLNDG